MVLVYTPRVMAGTRTVVQPGSPLLVSGSSRLCRRYIFPVLLELLLGLVFVEFASERGSGAAGPAGRHRTQSGRCDLTNGSLYLLVAGTPKK